VQNKDLSHKVFRQYVQTSAGWSGLNGKAEYKQRAEERWRRLKMDKSGLWQPTLIHSQWQRL